MKLTKYIGLTLAMTVFASCSNEEELDVVSWENDPSAVHLQAKVGNCMITRTTPQATDDQQKTFSVGDLISVQAESQNAAVYTLSAGGTWTPEGSYLKWGTAEEMNFKAYYPATAGASTTSFTIPADQSTDIAKADFMTFEGILAKAPKIDLPLVRKTARIVVKLNLNTEFKDQTNTISDLRIKGYGQISGSSSSFLTNFIPYEVEKAVVPTYVALVAPNTSKLDKTIFIRFKINDRKYNIQGLPAVEAGKSYTYNLKVGKQRVDVESVSVNPWETSDLGVSEVAPTDTQFDPQTHTITTTKPGTILPEMITEATGSSGKLIIVGPINGFDLKYIREAAGCDFKCIISKDAIVTDLNLKDARIKASDDVYANYYWNGWYYDAKISEDNQIGAELFCRSKLSNLVLPDNLQSLGFDALINCNSLTHITLPATITKLDEYCFYGCDNFETITLEEGIQITTIPKHCFSYTILKNFTTPSQVTNINWGAFWGLTDMNLVISSSVKFVEGAILGDGSNNVITIEGKKTPERQFGDEMFKYLNGESCTLILDSSWSEDITNGNTFKGATFKEIKFSDSVQ